MWSTSYLSDFGKLTSGAGDAEVVEDADGALLGLLGLPAPPPSEADIT
jgi:hypothetical protein